MHHSGLNSNYVSDEGNILESDLLPSYAKSYILPRRMSLERMRKLSTSISEEKCAESNAGTRRQSYARKQSMVRPDFQMSMLRVSLEEKQMIAPSNVDPDNKGHDLPRQSSLDFKNIDNPR